MAVVHWILVLRKVVSTEERRGKSQSIRGHIDMKWLWMMMAAMVLKLKREKRLKGGGRRKRSCERRRSVDGMKSDAVKERNGMRRS
jgi:hypothetical protein